MLHRSLLSALLAGVFTLSLAATPALATDDQTRRDIEELKQLVLMQNEKIKQLEAQLSHVATVSGALTPEQAASIEPTAGDKKSATITRKGVAPEFSFDDGDTTFAVKGRLQADAAFFDGDKRDIPDQYDLRRAWIGVEGKFDKVWHYALYADMAPANSTRPAVEDAWIGYGNPSKGWMFRAGNQTEPFSLERQTSDLNQSFVERSLVHDAFHPGRTMGLSASYAGEQFSAAVDLSGESPNDGNNAEDQRMALTGRATVAPLHDDDQSLHLGASARYAKPDGGESQTYSVRPGTRQSDGIFALQETLANVEDTQTYGLEAAYRYKSAAVQGEYMTVLHEREGALSDPAFDGWYVQGSWFITGEQRPYSPGRGNFGRVKPEHPVHEGGFGAWELAARYATLDFNDSGFGGGQLDTIHAAINWFPHEQLQFGLNYIVNDTDNDAFVPDDDPQALVLRTQFDF